MITTQITVAQYCYIILNDDTGDIYKSVNNQ